MKINMQEISGDKILAGALNGKKALNKLLDKATIEPDRPEPIFLDFSAIEVATASFLRESVLAFRDIVRGRRSRFYPVVANVKKEIKDELMEILQRRGYVLMACVLSADDSVDAVSPIGELSPKQQLTFDLVHEHGNVDTGTDAGTLMSTCGEEEGPKHTTAWNNRLASLATLGLIVELSRGRAKRYRPLFVKV